ncbi:hypothetical protein BDZ97DRAFT_2076722 [Flammula alnicola]|nr:hypothetical protein BDZ97DRAFT_2076722 [Flammula alnicola]
MSQVFIEFAAGGRTPLRMLYERYSRPSPTPNLESGTAGPSRPVRPLPRRRTQPLAPHRPLAASVALPFDGITSSEVPHDTWYAGQTPVFSESPVSWDTWYRRPRISQDLLMASLHPDPMEESLDRGCSLPPAGTALDANVSFLPFGPPRNTAQTDENPRATAGVARSALKTIFLAASFPHPITDADHIEEAIVRSRGGASAEAEGQGSGHVRRPLGTLFLAEDVSREDEEGSANDTEEERDCHEVEVLVQRVEYADPEECYYSDDEYDEYDGRDSHIDPTAEQGHDEDEFLRALRLAFLRKMERDACQDKDYSNNRHDGVEPDKENSEYHSDREHCEDHSDTENGGYHSDSDRSDKENRAWNADYDDSDKENCPCYPESDKENDKPPAALLVHEPLVLVEEEEEREDSDSENHPPSEEAFASTNFLSTFV